MRLGDLDEALRMINNSKVDRPICTRSGLFLWGQAHNCAISCVEATPTIDAVPVVRCKDCKHYEESTGWCMKHSHFVDSNGFFCYPHESPEWKMFKEDDFCSYGEQKDGGG